MNILFVQTSDAIRYRGMLEITSRTVREFVARHGFTYHNFTGIIRGYHPWHATFNRIRILRGLIAAGYSGWVCYMDADAYIADLDFDVGKYLNQKDDVALIAAHAGTDFGWWDINAGVFFIDTGHPVARTIVENWNSVFDMVTDDHLKDAVQWQNPDDQYLLHEVLKALPEAQKHVFLDIGSTRTINYGDARFIRQILAVRGSFNERIRNLRIEVNRVLGCPSNALEAGNPAHADVAAVEEAFVLALYRVLASSKSRSARFN